MVLAVGAIAIALLLMGERLLPGRPVALAVVALAIFLASVLGLPAIGVPVTGHIPEGLPTLAGPALRLRDVEGIVPRRAPSRRSMVTSSIRVRSSSASVPPTWAPPWGMATLSPAACRSRLSMTKRAHVPR